MFDALHNNQCIGIFPEGGSHDQTKLLPLKPGVSIMALGSMLKFPNLKVNVIGCGLKYFKPHKFWSKAIIEFSEPYEIPQELVDLYKVDKKEACGQLLKWIERKMMEVTLHADNYSELKSI